MKADKIFYNCKAITMDSDTKASAFAVLRDRFLAVGSAAQIGAYSGPGTEMIDLKGAAVIPGFIESHNHASTYAMNLMQVDCSSPPNLSISDVKDRIRAKAAITPAGEWIRGFGFDDTLIGDKRHLNRYDLDEAAPDHPIQIMHISVHFSYINTRGLEIAGIGTQTPQPEGGIIETDGQGRPTGLLIEAGAMDLVRRHVPLYTADRIKEALLKTFAYFHREGITSIHDGGIGFFQHGSQIIQAYQELSREKRLTVRVSLTLIEEIYQRLFKLGFGTGFGNEFLRLGSVKTWQDGSIQGFTGALSEPYHTKPELSGELLIPQDELNAMVERYHAAGLQVAVHANGDRAVESVLSAFEAAFKKFPQSDRRHMIIHAQMASDDHVHRMKNIGVIPNFFVNHVYYWGDRHEALFLGPERASRISPLRAALDAGIDFCLHSDLPVTPADPMFSIHTAVNRVTRNGKVLGHEQRIPFLAALKAYTTAAAWVSFAEDERGAIRPGLLADFVILSADPLEIPAEEIKSVRPLQTWLGGKMVFPDDCGESFSS